MHTEAILRAAKKAFLRDKIEKVHWNPNLTWDEAKNEYIEEAMLLQKETEQ